MKYKVIHPFSGVSSEFDSLELAEAHKQAIIAEEVSRIDSKRIVPHIAEEILIAKEFAKRVHNYDGDIDYYHSVWNVDMQSRLSAFYTMITPDYIWEIKVSNGEVTEHYRLGKNDGTVTSWYTMLFEANDLVTKEKIEYYKYVDKDLNILPNANPGYNFENIYACAKYDLNDN